jgi:mannose-6-phosphate isomerase-like protein (cupin superfamily)
MKMDIKEFAGKVKPVIQNETYSIHDLEYLENLNVCLNILHPGKETRGHEHDESDEVYVIMDGKGEVQIGTKRFIVDTGDILLVKRGEFHKTFNTSGEDLVYLTIFEKYAGRGGNKPVNYKKPKESLEELMEDAEEKTG